VCEVMDCRGGEYNVPRMLSEEVRAEGEMLEHLAIIVEYMFDLGPVSVPVVIFGLVSLFVRN
jgi:hypothetical protein